MTVPVLEICCICTNHKYNKGKVVPLQARNVQMAPGSLGSQIT